MKKTKFNEEQIVMALYMADHISVEEVTRKTRHCPSDFLSMEIKIWGGIAGRSETP